MDRLRIAFVAAEVAPFSKTGGLGDVASALPRELHRRGHDVRVFTPLHGTIDLDRYGFVPVSFLRDVPVTLGHLRVCFTAYVGRAPGTDLDVYFIHCPELLFRRSIYTADADEHLRFALLTHAVFLCCQRMGWAPQVIHANDWHTALAPIYRRTIYAWDQLFAATRTVLTIHNIAYQGVFKSRTLGDLGLAEHQDLLPGDDLGAGRLRFLATGIRWADVVSTVSETYAREIQTPAYGAGLDGLLRQRGGSVIGIVNGVDYGTWDPESDPHLACRYGIEDAEDGKAQNKRELLQAAGLEATDGPLFGIVSRLTEQKGLDLLDGPLQAMLTHRRDTRLVVLGSGERRYERFFESLARSFPDRVAFNRGYDEPHAHRIEAAADVFLMPSRFEPCGLNQLYSLRYGTAPLVRRTGGLADTVTPFHREQGEGDGFVFEHFDTTGLSWALEQALDLWPDRDAWRRLLLNGMHRDFSWQRQATPYENLYSLLAAGA